PIVPECAQHDRIGVAGNYPSGVLNRLAAAELAVRRVQSERASSQLKHRRLEGKPRARGRLLEEEHQRAPAQAVVEEVLSPSLFELARAIGDRLVLRQRKICQPKEISLHLGPPKKLSSFQTTAAAFAPGCAPRRCVPGRRRWCRRRQRCPGTAE